jgi:maltose/moltooligosaccharide transporter
MQDRAKLRLSFSQIVQMNIGFLGLQFSFGLQQGNMAPIYSFLGAHESALPFLQLAGPLTGLLVQPVIGAMSDRTLSRFGRRTPYFLVGAMPFSPALWVAAVLLWVLDAGNKITMEPYRAYVSDRLASAQHQIGFLTQSAFTGLAQTLAYLTPSLLVAFGMGRDRLGGNGIPLTTTTAFVMGSVLSISTIVFSILRVRELPLDAAEIAAIRRKSAGLGGTLREIWDAVVEMPVPMRRMAWMCLFQWYAMMCYWNYVIYSISRSVFGTADPGSGGFRAAVLVNGQVGAFYNAIAFFAAFAMVPFTRRFGPARAHAACLAVGGAAMLAIPQIHSVALLFVPAIGIGLTWGSMMGNPYVMLAGSIPPERTGVYMGIFNMFIVIPMLLIAVTLPFFYNSVLHGDARNVLVLSGVLMFCAALAALRVTQPAPLRLPA